MRYNINEGDADMREEYDFTNARPNPYAAKLKSEVTLHLNRSVIDYFKEMSEDTEIPYERLIDIYLYECMREKRKPGFLEEK